MKLAAELPGASMKEGLACMHENILKHCMRKSIYTSVGTGRGTPEIKSSCQL